MEVLTAERIKEIDDSFPFNFTNQQCIDACGAREEIIGILPELKEYNETYKSLEIIYDSGLKDYTDLSTTVLQFSRQQSFDFSNAVDTGENFLDRSIIIETDLEKQN
jgi:hypothetical protein